MKIFGKNKASRGTFQTRIPDFLNFVLKFLKITIFSTYFGNANSFFILISRYLRSARELRCLSAIYAGELI